MKCRFQAPALTLTLVLAACGGGESSAACVNDFWNGDVGACLPSGWSGIDQETLRSRGIPEETIAAFRRDEKVAGQYPSASITKEVLSTAVTSAQYSDASMSAVAVLPGYGLFDSVSVPWGEEEELTLHIFQAQPIDTEPAKRFYQLSAVSEDAGYTISASVPLSVSNEVHKEIMTIMQSLTFTEQE